MQQCKFEIYSRNLYSTILYNKSFETMLGMFNHIYIYIYIRQTTSFNQNMEIVILQKLKSVTHAFSKKNQSFL